jgi:hypothetical protein
MRAQLRGRNECALAMCPVVHNISGQLVMNSAIRPAYVKGSGIVCHKKNFGNTRCLYSVTGNVLFRPGKVDMVFKGVRSVTAMNRTLTRATHGELVKLRVSMLVMTIQLQHSFSVREQCPLELALRRFCGADAVYILPRSEEESNALIFRIDRWAAILSNDAALALKMDQLTCIVSISRFGNCTLRVSSPDTDTLHVWLETQLLISRALCLLGHFMLDLEL